MDRVVLAGTPPPEIVSALADAGVHQIQRAPQPVGRLTTPPTPDPWILWAGDPGAHQATGHLCADAALVIVLCSDDVDRRIYFEAGAADVIALSRPPAELGARIRTAHRVHVAWRRRDQGERRRNRRALTDLRQTSDLFDRIIGATPNPVMSADTRGRVLVFNRASERLLGYESTWALEHMHVADIYASPSDARRILRQIRKSPELLVQGVETRLRARSGEQIPVLLAAAELHAADGMPIGTVGVFQDQREEHALLNRLEQTTEQLIQTEKRAAAVHTLASTAHELNQPLTAVMGALELLGMRPGLDPEVQLRLERAYDQLERMAEMVRELARRQSPK